MFVWVLQQPKCYNPQLDSRSRIHQLHLERTAIPRAQQWRKEKLLGISFQHLAKRYRLQAREILRLFFLNEPKAKSLGSSAIFLYRYGPETPQPTHH
jgi:hypothetical protein